MSTQLRVLIVEDSEDDALLLLRELRRGGYDPTSERVDTPEAMDAALDLQIWDIVLSDYAMPRFSMLAALTMIQEKELDLPFVIVSGAIGEEAAVEAMRAGANDYIMKGNLARLVPVIERELREAEVRRKRKRAEEAWWESEEKMRRFMDSATDFFNIWDSELNLIDLNEASLRYPLISHPGGARKEDFIGKNMLELEPHIKERGIYDQYLEVIRTEKPLFLEDIISHPKLGDIHLAVRAFKVGDGLGIITQDITERKRAEEALRESKEKLRVMFESISDGVTFTDLEGNIEEMNEAALRLHGYSHREEVIGRSGIELVAKKDRARARENMRRIFTEGRGGMIEYTLLTKDGREFEAEYSGALVRDSAAKAAGFIGVSRDITERKRAEAAVRDSEEKLRRFMDSATDFFTIWDSELNLVDLNEASLKYPLIRIHDRAKREDFIGKNMLELDPGVKERGRYDQYLEVIKSGKPFFAEDVVPHPELGEVHLAVRAFKVGDGLGIITQDITERKRAEEALRQSERLRALGEMAGGVAHDFNNILSVILGRAQLALGDVDEDKVRKNIQVIEQTALDAAKVVRRLQEFAGVRRDRAFEKVNLNQLVEGALQMVESRRLELEETAGVTIEIVAELNEVAPVAGDAAELREALVNILFNAMDAMPEGGKIAIRSGQKNGLVVLSVSDTGVGIPEEIKEKIFDPFFTTRAAKGTGLGLSVTYGIINKHGGSIEVESTKGKGATFYIMLPMAEGVKEAQRPEGEPLIVKPTKILLVDDDPEVSDILGLTLQQLGHRVRIATSGKEALSALKQGDYRLVITDLGMPDMSGRDVARAVKDLKPGTPVMLITGWGVQPDSEKMAEIDGVIEKPFSKDSLLVQIAQLLPAKNRVKRE